MITSPSTGAGGLPARCDWAVILVRGEGGRGRRCGEPRRVTRDLRAALPAVVDLYAAVGIRVAVAVRPDLHAPCQQLVRGRAVRWILCGGAGDSAAAAGAALLVLREEASHLWFHPVELVAVATETLLSLAERSRREPFRVVVPRCRDGRGDPVVLPVDRFAPVADPRLRGTLRRHLARWCAPGPRQCACVEFVQVTDSAIIPPERVPVAAVALRPLTRRGDD
ncbi:MAG: NTP transferase domain-containing protein [Candidatus Krumholzibacteriia bacterium]